MHFFWQQADNTKLIPPPSRVVVFIFSEFMVDGLIGLHSQKLTTGSPENALRWRKKKGGKKTSSKHRIFVVSSR